MADQNTEISDLELVERSRAALRYSYCPYSHFPVSAALLAEDGTVFTGVNVENASYGLSICAERTALCKAVSEGYRKFKAIAISSVVKDKQVAPCGACRQFMAEFGTDWTVILTKPDSTETVILKVSDLLPLAFVPDSLKEERVQSPVNGDSK